MGGSLTHTDCSNCDTCPLTNEELRTRVAAYKTDSAATEHAYGPIGSWVTSEVTDMSQLFHSDKSFNGDIGGWDTSSVMTMFGMFASADAFNQNIGGWDTSKVTDMSWMFFDAKVFNGDILEWCTSKVTDMNKMFRGAKAFSRSLPWDLSSLTHKGDMFT